MHRFFNTVTKKVQGMTTLGRIEAVLIGIQFGDQGDHLGLVGGFEGDGHGGSGQAIAQA